MCTFLVVYRMHFIKHIYKKNLNKKLDKKHTRHINKCVYIIKKNLKKKLINYIRFIAKK